MQELDHAKRKKDVNALIKFEKNPIIREVVGSCHGFETQGPRYLVRVKESLASTAPKVGGSMNERPQAQFRHTAAVGTAVNRWSEIGLPHFAQIP